MEYIYNISINNLNYISNFNLSVEDEYYLSFYNLKKKNIFYLYKLYMESYFKLNENDDILNIMNIGNPPNLEQYTLNLNLELYKEIINHINQFINNTTADHIILLNRLCNKNITDYNIIDYILYLKLYQIIYMSYNIFNSLFDGEIYEIIIQNIAELINISPNKFKSYSPNIKGEHYKKIGVLKHIEKTILDMKVRFKKELTTVKTAINYFYNN